jgi:hypothetical protein
LAIRSKPFGGSRAAAAARVLADLASLYKAQDQLEHAEPLYRRAIALERRALGRLHPELAVLLEQAASVLRRRGEPSDAQAFEAEAASIRAVNARDVPALAGN